MFLDLVGSVCFQHWSRVSRPRNESCRSWYSDSAWLSTIFHPVQSILRWCFRISSVWFWWNCLCLMLLFFSLALMDVCASLGGEADIIIVHSKTGTCWPVQVHLCTWRDLALVWAYKSQQVYLGTLFCHMLRNSLLWEAKVCWQKMRRCSAHAWPRLPTGAM